jgi:hypothetical protein
MMIAHPDDVPWTHTQIHPMMYDVVIVGRLLGIKDYGV